MNAQYTCSLTADPTVITGGGSSNIHCNDCSVAGCESPFAWQYQCDLSGGWTNLTGGTVDDITIDDLPCSCLTCNKACSKRL